MKLSPKCRTSFLKRLEMNPSGRPLCHSPNMTNVLNYVKIYIIICNYVCIYMYIFVIQIFRCQFAVLSQMVILLFSLTLPCSHSFIYMCIDINVYIHTRENLCPPIYIYPSKFPCSATFSSVIMFDLLIYCFPPKEFKIHVVQNFCFVSAVALVPASTVT